MYSPICYIGVLICVISGQSSNGHELLNREPEFRVFSPNHLQIFLPKYDGLKVILFRLSLRDGRNVEFGQNSERDVVAVDEENLNLQKGDTINYLISFEDVFGKYRAQVGSYVFDGTYKNVEGSQNKQHRRRRRRNLLKNKSAENVEPNEKAGAKSDGGGGVEGALTENRFGYRSHHQRDHQHQHNHQHHHNHQHGKLNPGRGRDAQFHHSPEFHGYFEDFGPGGAPYHGLPEAFPLPGGNNKPPQYFNPDCGYHYGPDLGHQRPSKPLNNVQDASTTTTGAPSIDIRFSEN